MKSPAGVKLDNATEIKKRLMQVCLEHCRAPNDNNLLKIGAYVGDFANNLRSALNYTIHEYAEVKLKSLLSERDYTRIEKSLDFPCFDTRERFDNNRAINHIQKHDKRVYGFLEGTQPYHRGSEWLRWLADISNKDKHIVTTQIQPGRMNVVAFERADKSSPPSPQFFGSGLNKMLVVNDETIHVHALPCYYFPYGGFAVKGGKWVYFFIPIGPQRALGLTRFTETVPLKIVAVIDRFRALM